MKDRIGLFLFVLGREIRILPVVLLAMTIIEAAIFNSITVGVVFIAALLTVAAYHDRIISRSSGSLMQRLRVTESEIFLYNCVACILCYLFVWLFQKVLLTVMIRNIMNVTADANGWSFVCTEQSLYPFYPMGNVMLLVRNGLLIVFMGILDAANQFIKLHESLKNFRIHTALCFIFLTLLYRCDIWSYENTADIVGLMYIGVSTLIVIIRTYESVHHGKKAALDE